MLGDWLLKSGARSDEQMVDLEGMVFCQEWQLPQDSPHGMLIYAMVQELATWVHYRNLRQRVEERGDPVLSRLLRLIAVDERSHHAFYRQVVQVFLRLDRRETLEQLRRVLLTFSMPAVYLLAEIWQRVAAIRGLGIFDADIFSRAVYHPILEVLGCITANCVTAPRSGRASRAGGSFPLPLATGRSAMNPVLSRREVPGAGERRTGGDGPGAAS